MLGFIKKLFGTKQDRDVNAYSPIIDEINSNFEAYQSLTNDQLRNKTTEFRERIKDYLQNIDAEMDSLIQKNEDEEDIYIKEEIYNEIDQLKKQRNIHLEEILKEILPEAFAVVKETANRFSNNETLEVTATQHDRNLAAKKQHITIQGDTAIWKNRWIAGGNEVVWNMLHYDVQLIGGMVLNDGKIAEMGTGEGKTLVSTLPAYLNGLSGEGVHIVTVNDYLSKRDSEWNGPLFEFLFLTVDCIDKYKPHSPERINAYHSDITYGTNNEFGFDYLRDNMVYSKDEIVQRKHHFAMVDEVDSVLIDDARTPLIISGPAAVGKEEQEYIALKPQVEKLIAAQRKLATDFLTEAKKKIEEGDSSIEEGGGGMALLRSYRALPKNRPLIKFLSEDGVKVLLQKTENHYMQEQSKHMNKVDVPLLFTIDEKNRNVDLTENGVEYLSQGNNDSQFYVMPDITLEIMAIESNPELDTSSKSVAKEQLAQDFSIKSQRLHTISQLLKAYTLFEKDEEYVVIDGDVKIVDEQTGRLMEGRRYSDGLHQALEAKENVKIGDITQTYATVTLQNYFRMYHKLCGMTGTAETEAGEFWQIYKLDVVVIPTNRAISRKDEEDLVFKTTREKYNAVIDEIVRLREAGRPVLVGTTSVDISEKLSRMLQLRNINHNVLNAKQNQREAEVVAEAGKAGAITIATNMAGRGTDIKLGAGVKEAGGLAIIGTERHDSRRVDRQLRGRAGRQGDPGTSQFFVSLEDNLMRLFQSERIASLMDKMGHKDGDIIQHSMVSKSIERAQKKVEENNFGIRKRLLEYDDVMNIQREAIYSKRYNGLTGDRLAVDLHSMFSNLIEQIVSTYKPSDNYAGFTLSTAEYLGLVPEITESEFRSSNADRVYHNLLKQFMDFYHRKGQKINEILLPIAKQVFENDGHRYKRIAVPFSDGRSKPLNIAAELETAVKSNGKSLVKDIEKAVTLELIDSEWKEHLRNMDELKESVQSASFEQKDPLVIYKMEAYRLFELLIQKVNQSVTSYLSKGMLMIEQNNPNVREAKEQRPNYNQQKETRSQSAEESRAAAEAVSSVPKQQTVLRDAMKVGRNDLCPCGSGKKFKHCHGV
jgi:preprotein translocase subunit SecA